MNPLRVLIFSGGNLGSWALRLIRPGDMLIGVDAGALFLVRHGFRPHFSLGDFDSVTLEEAEEIERASEEYLTCDPVMKDWTDTEMAFDLALEKHPSEIILCGVLGTRWDHSLANVHLLRKGLDAGVSCVVADSHNEIRLMDGRRPMIIRQGRHTHVSLLPLSLEVTGITLEGFAYPLNEATLTLGQSLGISNVLKKPECTITVSGGMLLVIQSSDLPEM